MSTRDEDQAWRAIVENYGDRAVLDETPQESAELDPHAARPAPEELAPDGAEPPVRDRDLSHFPAEEPPLQVPQPEEPTFVPTEARFVAPDPPLPALGAKRWLAWICVLGSPVAFILLSMIGSSVGGLTAVALTFTFVGGFAWLVARMPQEPRDPWDDGSRV